MTFPSLEDFVDVLIIGAGPAGLMCANALVHAGVSVRIIDKKYVPPFLSQLQGYSCVVQGHPRCCRARGWYSSTDDRDFASELRSFLG